MKIFFQSFKFRIFALFSLFIMVISIAFTTLLYLDQSKSLTENLINHGKLLTGLLGHTSKIGIVAGNKSMLKNPMEGVLGQEDVVGAAVFNMDGKLIDRKSGKGLTNHKLLFRKPAPGRKMDYVETDSFFEFWTIVESKIDFSLMNSFVEREKKDPVFKLIGYVNVTITKSTLKTRLLNLLVQCITIGIIFTVFGSLALYYVVNRITQPLNMLTKGVRAIGRSDKVELLPVKTRDEIGKLTRAFNEMYISLENRKSALVKSEEKYNQFFYDDLAGAYITDLSGKILNCNPSFANLLGYRSPQEVMYFNIDTFYKDSQSFNSIVRKLYSGIKLEPCNSVMIHRDGSSLYTLENTVGIYHEGELLEVKGYVIDVSKQRNLEEQLRQSQKMEAIGTLAGGIAHDFNNILYPIMGYTEMALDDLTEDSEYYVFMNEILKASRRAKDLVLQILSFSHKSEQEKKPINIHFVVKEALKLLRASIPSTIDIVHDIQKDCGYILADSTQIHQVVMNLCTNAFHAMERKGGTLKVTLGSEKAEPEENTSFQGVSGDELLVLSVRDTGEGIDSSVIDKIFDPYFTTKEFGKGTGLGLSVVHGIIKSSGGDIQINSEKGEGTEVKVAFPIIKSVAEFYKTENITLMGGSEKILLVEDEIQIANMTKRQLEKIGYIVTCFTDSMDAFEHYKENRDSYQVIITDQIMKDLTGIEFTKKVFELTPDIPVIMCTGFADKVIEKEAYEIGIKKVIQKPVHRNILSATIRKSISELP